MPTMNYHEENATLVRELTRVQTLRALESSA
jgi:hypothetical protein